MSHPDTPSSFESLFAPEPQYLGSSTESVMPPWKVLLVDDEADVHAALRLELQGITVEDGPLQLFHARSSTEAKTLLEQHPDVALIFLDVVMETEQAGLELVHHIREALGNRTVQIVLVTGQPGYAPQRDVVRNYEIEGYRLKTELTGERIYSLACTALRTYRALRELSREREQLRLALCNLQQERTLKAAIVESSDDAIISKTMDGTITSWNAGAETVFGYTAAEMLGQPLHKLIPVDRHQEEEAVFNSIRNGVPFKHYKTLRICKDGRVIAVSLTVSPIRDADGKVIGASKIARDITEREQISQALAVSEARARSMLKTAMDGVWLVDDQARFVEVNEAACRMLGYTRDELLNLRLPVVEALESGEEILTHIRRIHERGWDLFESVHLRKDGTRIPVEISVTSLQEQGQTVCFVRDITERRANEQAIRDHQALLGSIVNGTSDAIYVKDPQGRYMLFNAAAEKITSKNAEDVLGRDDRFLFSPEEAEAVMAGDRAVMEKGIVRTYEERVADASGATRIFLSTKGPLFDQDGQLKGLFGIARDITALLLAEEEHRQVQAQLLQAQKMEGLGVLAGGVAHDMNNVLGAIMGLASIHLNQSPEDSLLHKSMGTILKACTRGRTMVKGLLGFSRKSLEDARDLDLNELVREEIALLEQAIPTNVRVDLDLTPGLPRVYGDPSALSHMLMNLCLNALDAMPGGGILSLRTRPDPDHGVLLTLGDSGSGMSPEVLEKALTPFFTTKPQGKGTGLGLSIVYGTIKAHHGTLDIQSEPGRGTTVTLQFPALEAKVQPGVHENGAASLQPSRVLQALLVDDDELMQQSTRAVLESMGHRVLTAGCGEEALVLLEAGLPLDLVILDMNMPGLGGAGTLPRLRALRSTLPVLLATGRVDDSALALTQQPGVKLIPKPFDLYELQAALAEITRS